MNYKHSYLIFLLLASGSFALHLGLFAALGASHPAFSVKALGVEGLALSLAEAQPLLDAQLGQPLGAVNLGQLKSSLEALPLVRRASLRRDFPSTLRAVITERRPAAEVVSGGNIYVADESARVLPLAATGLAPRIYADFGLVLNGGQIIDENLGILLSVLGETPMAELSSLSLSRDRGLSFTLRGLDTAFFIGENPFSPALFKKAQRIAEAIGQNPRRRPKTVDLSGADENAIGYF